MNFGYPRSISCAALLLLVFACGRIDYDTLPEPTMVTSRNNGPVSNGGSAGSTASGGESASQPDASTSSSGSMGEPDAAATTTMPSSCLELAGRGSGVFTIDADGDGALEPLEVYCDQDTDGGGWTLAIVGSDDGQTTWTFNDRDLFTADERLVGDVTQRNLDFKSFAVHSVPFTDMLVIHQPSGIWASYHDVDSGTRPLSEFLAAQPFPNCDPMAPGEGVKLSAGTLTLTGALCDTDLYFNLGDREGALTTAECLDLQRANSNTTFGPSWHAHFNIAECAFDDPHFASLGPNAAMPDTETDNALAFGRALDLNTGSNDAGENFAQIYVR